MENTTEKSSSNVSAPTVAEVSRRRSSDGGSDEGSLCFSDAEDRSWHSPFNSNGDNTSYDDYRMSSVSDLEIEAVSEVPVHTRKSSAESSDCSVQIDLESGVNQVQVRVQESKLHLDKVEKDCRICHLTLETNSSNPESGIAIELGCSCKADLAAAHKHCAEAWFKIKGNKTCEICGSVARNVVGPNETELLEPWNETTSTTPATATPTESRSFWHGHRFLNFLLACMVFAFVISWLFHFNVPS